MRRSDSRTALTDEVERFQDEVRRLAFAVVRELVKQEIERKRSKLPAAKPRVRATSRAVAPAAAPATPTVPVAAAAPATPPATSASVTPAAPPAVPAPAQPAEPATTGRKRVTWTREAIINELATWMLSGTSIDATFVARHGPPGLVAATRRIFGRFDAALNVAGLHVSKLYPDGPPER
jgi:hypothetical protein